MIFLLLEVAVERYANSGVAPNIRDDVRSREGCDCHVRGASAEAFLWRMGEYRARRTVAPRIGDSLQRQSRELSWPVRRRYVGGA